MKTEICTLLLLNLFIIFTEGKPYKKASENDQLGHKSKVEKRRCGRHSSLPVFANSKPKWSKNTITYKVVNYTAPFSKFYLNEIFEKITKVWTRNSKLKISKSGNDADILIHFSKQDGPSDILGYAYLPDWGDMYFDQDENWGLEPANDKTYFGWVAAHEMGHSLGLDHDESPNSIMHPYYSTIVTMPTNKDIKKITSLYGKKAEDFSELCTDKKIDAILDNMIIKDKNYWNLRDDAIESSVDTAILEIPKKIDAAFKVHSTYYFFVENVYYKVSSKSVKSKPISAGFDKLVDNIDAAFFNPEAKVIYFFKGSHFYTFNIAKPIGKRLSENAKVIGSKWPGIPNDLDAVTLLDSRILFVKNFTCYFVDVTSDELINSQDCADVFDCK